MKEKYIPSPVGQIYKLKRNLFTWRHLDINSDILFNKESFDVIMWYFSVIQRLHVLLPFLYEVARSIISQVSFGSIPEFFNSQTYLESSVDFEAFSCLKL